MSPYKSCIVEVELTRMFEPAWLRKKAKETGLVKRERKVDPVVFFWVMTLSYGVRLQRTLYSLKRSYEKKTKCHLSYGSWYDRFTPELVAFLKVCVAHGIEHLAAESKGRLSAKLKGFQDLLIQDSTIVRLHKKLAKKWPAVRARKAAAGVKVSLLISAIANGPKTIALYGERTSELRTLKLGPWIRDRILLIDLGFFKHNVFAKIKKYGGYFVSRHKKNSDPIITAVHNVVRGRSINVVGKRLSEILPLIKRGILDIEVELHYKKRKYAGKQTRESTRFRLVAVQNKEEKKYHLYLTNIPQDTLTAEEIAALYSARWNIELVFKELKSRYALDQVATTNPQIIEALIYTAILTLLISRRIYNLVREHNPGKKMVRYTQLRWSTIFTENASDQLTTILAHQKIQRTFETVMNVYNSHALDPNVNRHRLMEQWTA